MRGLQLAIFSSILASATAFDITLYEKLSYVEGADGASLTKCDGKTKQVGDLKVSDGCQKLGTDMWGIITSWTKPEDNGLAVWTFQGERCCNGSPGDFYPWSDDCGRLAVNMYRSYRVVNMSDLAQGKSGENYDCYEQDD